MLKEFRHGNVCMLFVCLFGALDTLSATTKYCSLSRRPSLERLSLDRLEFSPFLIYHSIG